MARFAVDPYAARVHPGTATMSLADVVVAAAILVLARPAGAEPVSLLGRTIDVRPPAGYCTLGSSPIEQTLARLQREASEATGEVIHIAVECRELDEFVRGQRLLPSHWAEIVVLKARGVLKPVTGPREVFIAQVFGELPPRPVDLEAASRELQAALRNPALKLDSFEPVTIGRDERAAYLLTRIRAQYRSMTLDWRSLAALTVVNELPLALYVFEPMTETAASAEAQAAVLRDYLSRVVAVAPAMPASAASR